MEGTSSDKEDGRFSDEEGEHNVEKFMLCSFAQHACGPLLQRILEELCEVALSCHLSLDVIFLCQDGAAVSRVQLVAFGCKFSDVADLSGAKAVRDCES